MHTPLQSKPRIAFDTNMLLSIGQLKVDVFFEVEKKFGKKIMLAIPKQVLEELEKFKTGNETMKKDTGIALEEIKKHKVEKMQIDAVNADDALEEMAKQGFYIASNDAVLRKRIKGFGGKVIYLRQSRFLEIE